MVIIDRTKHFGVFISLSNSHFMQYLEKFRELELEHFNYTKLPTSSGSAKQ